MVSVCEDDWVVVIDCSGCAYGYCFLSDVDVAEAADLCLLVCGHGSEFELTDKEHVVEELEMGFFG